MMLAKLEEVEGWRRDEVKDVRQHILTDLFAFVKKTKKLQGAYLTEKEVKDVIKEMLKEYKNSYVLMSRGYGSPLVKRENMIKNLVLQYAPEFDFEHQPGQTKEENWYRKCTKEDDFIHAELRKYIKKGPGHWFKVLRKEDLETLYKTGVDNVLGK